MFLLSKNSDNKANYFFVHNNQTGSFFKLALRFGDQLAVHRHDEPIRGPAVDLGEVVVANDGTVRIDQPCDAKIEIDDSDDELPARVARPLDYSWSEDDDWASKLPPRVAPADDSDDWDLEPDSTNRSDDAHPVDEAELQSEHSLTSNTSTVGDIIVHHGHEPVDERQSPLQPAMIEITPTVSDHAARRDDEPIAEVPLALQPALLETAPNVSDHVAHHDDELIAKAPLPLQPTLLKITPPVPEHIDSSGDDDGTDAVFSSPLGSEIGDFRISSSSGDVELLEGETWDGK